MREPQTLLVHLNSNQFGSGSEGDFYIHIPNIRQFRNVTVKNFQVLNPNNVNGVRLASTLPLINVFTNISTNEALQNNYNILAIAGNPGATSWTDVLNDTSITIDQTNAVERVRLNLQSVDGAGDITTANLSWQITLVFSE